MVGDRRQSSGGKAAASSVHGLEGGRLGTPALEGTCLCDDSGSYHFSALLSNSSTLSLDSETVQNTKS